MPNNVTLEEGVEVLRQHLRQREEQVERLTAEIMALKQAIAILEGTPLGELPQATSNEYRDLGITAATKRFLREAGEPQDTRTIADTLRRRGLQSESKNFIATVYATLHANKVAFRRTSDGRWALKESEDAGPA